MGRQILNNFNYGYYYINAIPAKEFWRFFVDGALYHKSDSWRGYESREPGSLVACYNGLAFILDNLHKPLDSTFIKEIHKQVCDKVEGDMRVSRESQYNYKPGQYRRETGHFFVPDYLATLAGVREFLFRTKKINIEGDYQKIQDFLSSNDWKNQPYVPDDGVLSYINDVKSYIYYAPYETTWKGPFDLEWKKEDQEREDKFENRVTLLCESYNKSIKSALSSQDKLRIIARHIQDFELLHPFPDANGRTFVNLLLNKMLIENGFPPAIFYQPNVFDLYSNEELVDVIKDAMLNAINLIENGLLHNFPTLYATSQEVDTENKKTERARKVRDEKYKIDQTLSIKDRDELLEFLYTTQNDSYKLHQAIAGNNKAKVENLIAAGIDVTKKADDSAPPLYRNKTPLEVAILSNQRDMIELLIKHGININEQVDSLVNLVVQENNTEMLLFLIEKCGLDIKRLKQNPKADPLVIKAMEMKNGSTIAGYLLEVGFDPNLADKNGTSTFARIAMQGNPALLNAAIKYGADTTYVDKDGGNALFFAHVNVVEALIKNHGLNVGKKNNHGLDFFDYRLELCRKSSNNFEQFYQLIQIDNPAIQAKLAALNTGQKLFSIIWELNYSFIKPIFAKILMNTPCNFKPTFPPNFPQQYIKCLTDALIYHNWDTVTILLLHMPSKISLSDDLNKILRENRLKIFETYRQFLKNKINSNDKNAVIQSIDDVIDKKSKLGIVLSELTGMQSLTSSFFSNVVNNEIRTLKNERDILKSLVEQNNANQYAVKPPTS